jgi:hypothetical protein
MDNDRFQTLRSEKLGMLQASYNLSLRVFELMYSDNEWDRREAECTIQFIRQMEIELDRLDAEMNRCIGFSN